MPGIPGEKGETGPPGAMVGPYNVKKKYMSIHFNTTPTLYH